MTPIVANSRTLFIAVAIWGGCLAVGFGGLMAYSLTPGAQSAPPSIEPAGLGSAPWRLVMAIHPHCPCTRASLAELERLLSRVGDKVRCEIVVYAPHGESPDWSESPTVAFAGAIPGVAVVHDPGGESAKRAGVHTSGGVVLYDAAGEPRYHGGLTASRNHEGDNLGAQAIRALVRGEEPAVATRPVFGCSLTTPAGDDL